MNIKETFKKLFKKKK